MGRVGVQPITDRPRLTAEPDTLTASCALLRAARRAGVVVVFDFSDTDNPTQVVVGTDSPAQAIIETADRLITGRF